MNGIDQNGFDQIFLTWYDRIRNFLYYKSGNKQVAEDIAQDTFLKLWEKRVNIRPETVKYLLYKIATNLFLNRIEHQKVTIKFKTKQTTSGLAESADFDLEMHEFDQRLQAALNSLDEKQRIVFLMNRIDGFTYNQIAEQLGLSVKAIEKRMERH